MLLLIENSLNKKNQEKENPKKYVEDMVNKEEILEFYRYKFNSVSKELHEVITSHIINQLKIDMNELQNDLFTIISKDIDTEFRNAQ